MNATLPVRNEIVKQLRLGRRRWTLLREIEDELSRNRYGVEGAVTKEWKLIYTRAPK